MYLGSSSRTQTFEKNLANHVHFVVKIRTYLALESNEVVIVEGSIITLTLTPAVWRRQFLLMQVRKLLSDYHEIFMQYSRSSVVGSVMISPVRIYTSTGMRRLNPKNLQ